MTTGSSAKSRKASPKSTLDRCSRMIRSVPGWSRSSPNLSPAADGASVDPRGSRRSRTDCRLPRCAHPGARGSSSCVRCPTEASQMNRDARSRQSASMPSHPDRAPGFAKAWLRPSCPDDWGRLGTCGCRCAGSRGSRIPFQKKIENHAAAVELYFMYYNFGRVHQTLRVTPAMEARVSDHVWSVEEIVALLPS